MNEEQKKPEIEKLDKNDYSAEFFVVKKRYFALLIIPILVVFVLSKIGIILPHFGLIYLALIIISIFVLRCPRCKTILFFQRITKLSYTLNHDKNCPSCGAILNPELNDNLIRTWVPLEKRTKNEKSVAIFFKGLVLIAFIIFTIVIIIKLSSVFKIAQILPIF